ncbi:MAG: hypothetical protein Kow0032_13980 [Methyloligellaceae bacterium]
MPAMRADGRVLRRGDALIYKADWKLFLPAVIVAALYILLWLVLLALGKGETTLARAVLLVLVVGVPVLLVQAFLRYMSFELRLFRRRLLYRRGWVRPRWRRIALEDVADVRVAYGPLGRLLGNGALVISFHTGRPLRLADIGDAEDAARQISRRLRVLRSH